MEQMVNLTIDNIKVSVPAGTSVLEAAKQAGINIPTLCYLKDVNAITGSIKQPHVIDTAKCIKCGSCIETCKFGAISKM